MKRRREGWLLRRGKGIAYRRRQWLVQVTEKRGFEVAKSEVRNLSKLKI